MRPIITELPYARNALLSLFSPFAAQPWAMLLHSADSEHPHRFDIMVAEPAVTLVTRGDSTLISRTDRCSHHHDDPFWLVQQELDRAGLMASPDEDVPFQGGALGLFGYDLARRCEQIPSLAEADIGLPDMAIGIYRWAVIADRLHPRLKLVSYDDPAPLLARLQAGQIPPPAPFYLTGRWQANISRERYGEKFRQIQQYLQAGECYQVCLSQRFSAPCCGDAWQAFTHLLGSNRAPFSAFLRFDDGAVLSFSPERFLKVDRQQIETRPIKGTLARHADAHLDRLQAATLAASAKDRAENLMIVDLLRNDIGRIAEAGSVRVPELFAIEAFPAVWHMVSTVTGVLPADRRAIDVLRACFPGGSITGAPKIQAMILLDQLEPQRRNAWCGSIGYLSACGRMDTNIAIRTLTVFGEKLYCQAGGGIVADSQEEQEYQETLAKVAGLMGPLERFNAEFRCCQR